MHFEQLCKKSEREMEGQRSGGLPRTPPCDGPLAREIAGNAIALPHEPQRMTLPKSPEDPVASYSREPA